MAHIHVHIRVTTVPVCGCAGECVGLLWFFYFLVVSSHSSILTSGICTLHLLHAHVNRSGLYIAHKYVHGRERPGQ